MLAIPERGFQRSVNKNNVDRVVLGDWVEGTVLFADEAVSPSDIVDALTEGEICESQDLAHEIADEGWAELRERNRHIGGDPAVVFRHGRFERSKEWGDDVARSFLVLISLFRHYPKWAAGVDDANGRGLLFERLVHAAMESLLPLWTVIHAGWSPAGLRGVDEVAEELSSLLSTTGDPGEVQKWVGQRAKDGGLDLAFFRPFDDSREGVPLFLAQCASGGDWLKKLNDPPLNIWHKLTNSAVRPWRVLAIPFVVDADEMRRRCAVIEGPLLDRGRLLSAGKLNAAWIPAALAHDLAAWMEPRIQALPKL